MSSEDIIEQIKKTLEEHERRILRLEGMAGEKEKRHEIREPEENVKRLAEKLNVSEDDINKIFDVEGESLTLTNVIGKDDREKTVNTTLLVLLGYKYFFGMSDVLSQEIRRNLAENRVSLSSYSYYLSAITPSLVRRKGKVKSPKTTYRLTTLGEAEAKELLKNLVGNQ